MRHAWRGPLCGPPTASHGPATCRQLFGIDGIDEFGVCVSHALALSQCVLSFVHWLLLHTKLLLLPPCLHGCTHSLFRNTQHGLANVQSFYHALLRADFS